MWGKISFSVEELSQLETLDIKGGAMSGSATQIGCSNNASGCACPQVGCPNNSTGCAC